MSFSIKPHDLLLALIGVFALSGCSTVGTEKLDDFGKYLGLQPGVSTKKDVYERFGQPGDVFYKGIPPSAPSGWTYYNVHITPSGWTFVPYVGLLAGGSNRTIMESSFLFDSNSRLTSLHTSKDSEYHNMHAGLVRDIYHRNTDPKPARVKQEMSRIGKSFDIKLANALATIPSSTADAPEPTIGTRIEDHPSQDASPNVVAPPSELKELRRKADAAAERRRAAAARQQVETQRAADTVPLSPENSSSSIWRQPAPERLPAPEPRAY